MEIQAIGPWYFDFGEKDQTFDSAQDVAAAARACETLETGRLSISYDDGPRLWWERFLGLAPRYVSGFASLEWADGVASLVFLDDNWSEYRASDREAERMHKARAFQALEEALHTGQRPTWLTYRFVR